MALETDDSTQDLTEEDRQSAEIVKAALLAHYGVLAADTRPGEEG